MTPKERHETALRVHRVLGDIPCHEKFAVLGQVNIDIQAEVRNQELVRESTSNAIAQALMPNQAAAIMDEHFRQ